MGSSVADVGNDPGSGRVYGPAMQFRILGPLELDAGDGPLGLGGPKQRAVLAHLVVRANQVVPAATLIDELWGEDPPETARNTLQTYVSHLRKIVGADRITARPPGYVLAIGPDELDLTRFDALVDESKLARPTDARLARAALEEALSMWRGPALADVRDDPSLMAEATRLDALRLDTEEARLELLLELGEHARAVGELEALLARYPLRERSWGQLTLALYRSGRQADALAAFGRARSILADELGIDPSPELVRLHERILRQDPSLEREGEPLRGYRLLERVGQGRIGAVFRGIQPHVGREVAIKVFHQEVAADPSFIRRFEPEAQAVAALEHPHVVPVYDYWREPGGAYIVSRFLLGGSLAGVASRGEELAPAESERILEQVHSALDFAHRRGVAHGDLAPSNILLDPDGNAYLSDFRVAVGSPAEPADDLRRLEAIARQLLPGRAVRPGEGAASEAVTPEEPVEPRNPYKGLRAFGEADAQDFFGRAGLVRRIVRRLEEPRIGSRFLAVVGPSGSGKSSVVRAGVLPAIRAGTITGSEGWYVAEMFPGRHPMEELEAALLRVAARPVPHLLDQLEAGPRGLVDALGSVVPGDGEVLLVIDQFEEAFTLTAKDQERALFLEAVRVATADPTSRLRVIATLRADFYDRPLAYPRFGALLGERTEVVPPLTPDEVEQAITGPARSVGVDIEPGLAAVLITDVAHQVGGLPLLQYALTELFERREDGRLTSEAYRHIGGVAGALSARAERLYEVADAAGRTATRQVFLRLVTLGEGRSDTRRRVTRGALDAIGVDEAAVDAVLSNYGRHRLLTFDREPSTREPTVEIAHEALLTVWERLRGWIDEGREDLRQEQRLIRAAAEWRTSGGEPSFLLQGARLEQLAAWSAATTLTVGPEERAYLRTSLDRRHKELEEGTELRERTARLERRSVTRLRWLVAVLTVAALVASGLIVVVVGQRSRAVRAGEVANARELAAAAMANLTADPQRSVLLALEALNASEDHGVLQEAAQALHSAVAADRELLTLRDPSTANVAYSADGRLLATGGSAGGNDQTDVVLWDAETGTRLLTLAGHASDVAYVAFAPDSTKLVSSANDGLIVWDTATGDPVLRLDQRRFRRGAATFSPDGTQLVIGVSGAEPVARVWLVDATSGEPVGPPIRMPGAFCQAPVFSPDGRLIAAPAWGGVPVWDAATGRLLRQLPVPSACTVVFSPDGSRLASAGPDGGAVFDVGTGHEVFPLLGQHSMIGIDWSRSGALLATGGLDGTARVWDATTGEQRLVLAGTAGLVANVAFSPDGTRLLTGGGDGSARVWDVRPEGSAEWIGRAEKNVMTGVAYSPDGSTLVTTGYSGRAVLLDASSGRPIDRYPRAWDSATFSADGATLVTSGAAIRVLDLASGTVTASAPSSEGGQVALGPDGRSFATGDRGGVAVRDLTTGERIDRYGPTTAFDETKDVAFSPDGSLLVGMSGLATVRVWAVSSGEKVLSFQGQTGQGHDVAFSPGGSVLAVSGGGGTTLWRIPSGEAIATLSTSGSVQAAEFSPDGTLIATAGDDGVTRVWDVASRQEVLALPGHTDAVLDVAFSPDGTRLATVGVDGTLRVYLLAIRDLRRVARGRLTRGLTDQECRQYLHVSACPSTSP